MLIETTNHSITLYPKTYNELRGIFAYIKQELCEYDNVYNKRTGQKEREHKATFASSTSDRKEIRLLRSDLEPLLDSLEFRGVSIKDIEIKDVSSKEWETIEGTLKSGVSPRSDEQQEAIDFVTKDNELISALEAATGFGKTFCGYFITLMKKRRTAFVMEPGHIKTWLSAIESFCDIPKDKIIVIQGSAAIRAAIDAVRLGIFDYDFIFISSTTMRNYITDYENKEEPFTYDLPPQDFYSYLKIGFVIRDEAHEALPTLVKQTVYMNVPEVLYLSATLVSDNQFTNKIYEKIYPTARRWRSKPNQHIRVRSVFYGSTHDSGLKTNGARGYSHVTYEKSILKNGGLRDSYWEIIKRVIDDTYIYDYRPGLKALIICSTKNMCTFLSKQATLTYPDKTIGCYIHGAKSDVLYDRDIVFSTPKGAGTGVDIKNLYVGLNTVAINSVQLARQVMGRTRPVDLYREMSPYYVMLWNQDIKQHKFYERRRSMDCIGRCKNYKKMHIPYILRRTTNKTKR